VWPGDLNANGIANSIDILSLGFADQATGPARANMSVFWEPLQADDWTDTSPMLGTNFKHTDADGNGLIDDLDRLPITLNYYQTNDNFVELLGNNLPGNDLFAVKVDSVATPGGSLYFDIHLGKENAQIEDIYGIGFQLELDTQYVAAVIVDYSDSWIGQDEEVINYYKYADQTNHTGIAITRVDGNTVSGFGKIARVEIVITDVVLGLVQDSTACLPFNFDFNYVLGIDNEANDLMITAKGDALTIKHPSQLTSINEIPKNKFDVFPNPATNLLNILSDTYNINEVALYNQLGQSISHQTFEPAVQSTQIHFTPKTLPKGIYFLSIRSGPDIRIEKILIQ